MSIQRDPLRPNSGKTRQAGAPPERRLALSGLIHRTLLSVTEREQQRGRLVNVLILAQALLTLALAPGYIATLTLNPAIFIIGGALVMYLAALVFNRVFHRASTAAYILVIGGSVATAALAVTFALAASPLDAAQSSLLFVAVILETGILFAPEVTLITASTVTAVSAFALLLALAFAHTTDKQQAYLLVVYTLGLQMLAGLIAWLLAQFIFESAVEIQRAQEMQFAQARLEALTTQVTDQQRQVEESIRALQSTLTQAIAGEYTVQADIAEGPLTPLAESLNLLLQRVAAATQAEQMQARIQAAALPLIDSITRMTDSGTPTPTSLPIMTNTPLDSLSVVLSQMQASVAQRLARMQRLVGDVVGALDHSQDGLTGASEAVQEAQRIAGALIATTETLLKAAHRQYGILVRMRRLLATVLPPEIAQLSPEDGAHRETEELETPDALLGLGRDLGIGNPGYTGEFTAIVSDEVAPAGIAPLTVPLPIVTPDTVLSDANAADDGAEGDKTGGEAPGAARSATGDLLSELVEVWNLLTQASLEVAQLERSLSPLGRELGVQSRHLRTADANIAWFRQALDAVRSNAEQLQQIAGANVPPPNVADPLSFTPSRPLTPAGASRPLVREPADDAGTLAELARPGAQADTPPAPGSLRAADLISLESDPSLANVQIDAPGTDPSQK